MIILKVTKNKTSQNIFLALSLFLNETSTLVFAEFSNLSFNLNKNELKKNCFGKSEGKRYDA